LFNTRPNWPGLPEQQFWLPCGAHLLGGIMPIVNCKYCGKEMNIPQYRIDSGRGKFCSRYCLAKHTFLGRKKPPRTLEHRKKLGRAHIGQVPHNKGKLIKVLCEICHKEFEVWPSRFNKYPPKYCSRKCQHESMRQITGTNHKLWKRIQKQCEWCGKSVWVKPAKIHEFKYCSRQCQGTSRAAKMAKQSGPTSIEKLLMDEFDKAGIAYKFQYRIANWLVDIAIPSHRIAIEADGNYWHNNINQQIKDRNKDHWLLAHKWEIYRFTESQIRISPVNCVKKVIDHIIQG
jgi:very-short-patch-repair endonuclease